MFIVSLYPSDISWVGMGPMTGTISFKVMECLVDEPSQVAGFGNVGLSWAIQLLNNTYIARDDTSMRGVASRVSPSFRQVSGRLEEAQLTVESLARRMLRRTLTLLL